MPRSAFGSWEDLTMFSNLAMLYALLGTSPLPYAKPEILVEPVALDDAEALKKFVILDVRGANTYAEGHVPGAVRVDAAALSKAFSADTNDEGWAKRLGKLGVNIDSPVVVYGDDWREAARLWFILRYWGVKDVKLLNGGWTAWKAEKRHVSTQRENPKPVKGKVSPAANRVATKNQMLDLLKEKSALILDVRSKDEFCGDAGTARKKGSIPGAVHLEWIDFVNRDTQKLKSAGEIAPMLERAGITRSKPVVTYCQSGGRAAVSAFVLELMGGEQVRNYYRSWAEWGNAEDTPVAKPEKK
jgi:thiosulfate/3-mercaptopyruvate sulfurtransferase